MRGKGGKGAVEKKRTEDYNNYKPPSKIKGSQDRELTSRAAEKERPDVFGAKCAGNIMDHLRQTSRMVRRRGRIPGRAARCRVPPHRPARAQLRHAVLQVRTSVCTPLGGKKMSRMDQGSSFPPASETLALMSASDRIRHRAGAGVAWSLSPPRMPAKTHHSWRGEVW